MQRLPLLFEIKKHLKPTMIWRCYTGNNALDLYDKLKKPEIKRNTVGYSFACIHIEMKCIYIIHYKFTFSLKCCVVLLTNAFLSLWMQSRFFGAILRKPGLHKSRWNPSASPKSHSDMSHSQISPQGARWGNIFNLNLDTIGPVRHRKNGLGVLKPQKNLCRKHDFL